MAKRKETESRPEHSGFEGPAYGTVVPVGTEWKDIDGNTHLVTENGDKIIRKA